MRVIFVFVFMVFGLAGCNVSSAVDGQVEDYIAGYVTKERSIGSAITAQNDGITIEGVTYHLSDRSDQIDNFRYEIVKDEELMRVLFSIEGEQVRAVMVNQNFFDTNIGDLSSSGVVGSVAYPAPRNIYEYRGKYYTANMGDEWVDFMARDIELEVDFDKGNLRGNSLNTTISNYVEINGIVSRNGVELMIEDETENPHYGQGMFFGEDAKEFLGAYEEDNRLGLIYAEK